MDSTLIVIGGGPAGLAAAIYAASEGLDTLIVDKRSTLGGQASHSSWIENLIGFPQGISGSALMQRATKQAFRFGVRVLHDTAISCASNGSRLVALESGRILLASAVLVACGVQYRRLSIPSAHRIFGVFYGANPDELPKWKGKSVAVIGGANSAGQAALGFVAAGSTTTLVSRSPLSKHMSAYLIDALKNSTLTILEDEVKDFAQINRDKVGITLSSGKTLTADGVFVYIGHDPHTEWLPCDKDDQGFVITTPTFETSLAGIFAAGDVRSNRSKRVATAIGEGCSAVSSIHAFLKG